MSSYAFAASLKFTVEPSGWLYVRVLGGFSEDNLNMIVGHRLSSLLLQDRRPTPRYIQVFWNFVGGQRDRVRNSS